MKKSIQLALCLGLLMPVLPLPTTEAGSVFLKNGYILQGRIVERGDGMVVLGWQNGRVTIHDRFIDEVLLDPAEEELIRQQNALAEAEEERSAVVSQDFDLAGNTVLSLPESYEAILGVDRVPDFTPVETNRPRPDRTPREPINIGGEDSNSETEIGVETVRAPEKFEKIFPALGVALEVSEEWRVDEKENAIRVSRRDSPMRDYFTIDLWPETGIETTAALSVFEETLESRFPNFVVESGIDRSIGGNAAKTLVLSDPARGVKSHQQVLAAPRGVFVLGQFWNESSPSEVREDFDAMVNSVRFLNE